MTYPHAYLVAITGESYPLRSREMRIDCELFGEQVAHCFG